MDNTESLSLKCADHLIKRFEVSLTKLYCLLDGHVKVLQEAKKTANVKLINKEQIAASKTFKNLKYELEALDKLKQKILPSDLALFERRIAPLREKAFLTIVSFVELDAALDKIPEDKHNHPPASSNSQKNNITANSGTDAEEHGELQMLQQIQHSKEELAELEATARSWDKLQKDMQTVAEMMQSLSKIVSVQKEHIDTIEQNVEVATVRTRQGLVEIIKARRAKFFAVPIAGAAIGCVVGGPIGLIAGFKIAGLLTAGVGTFLGYKSGKYIKNRLNEDIEPVEGMLEAPTAGVHDDNDDTSDFHEFSEREITFSKKFK